ncbi:hypothetical protein HYH03_005320 [Edaphochlamys debaryana]|uniref:Uncharacterized protein n=1 Tax=Edaphochlamys debaryana TaxID=47281 RepID=A0A836C188_9CHLO|nr:hypothetical protein HYH03_005320 [Edaphochlamys debaryana]|eukprot:KAG2496495.1 hypothetical protein HYH03_005320 [Edaphochlamys debaryana]
MLVVTQRTMVNMAPLLDMLDGWNYHHAYAVSDCLAQGDDATCAESPPACLPCHASSRPGLPAGCPCNPGMACAEQPSRQCLEGRGPQPLPAGGVLLSRGLLGCAPFADPEAMEEVVESMELAEAGEDPPPFAGLGPLLHAIGVAATLPPPPAVQARAGWRRFGGQRLQSQLPEGEGLFETAVRVAEGTCPDMEACSALLQHVVTAPIPVSAVPDGMYQVLNRAVALTKLIPGTPYVPPNLGEPAPRLPRPESTFFWGDTCLARFPGQRCPIKGSCVKGDTCVWWRDGLYDWSREPYHGWQQYSGGHVGSTEYLTADALFDFGPPDLPSCEDPSVPGYWWSGQWRANVPYPNPSRLPQPLPGHGHENSSCVFHRIPRRQVVSCLRGKKWLFVGDSLTRQTVHRLIFYLRGYEVSVEHFHHLHVIYSFFDGDAGTGGDGAGAGGGAPGEVQERSSSNSSSSSGRGGGGLPRRSRDRWEAGLDSVWSRAKQPLAQGETFRIMFHWWEYTRDYSRVIKEADPDLLSLGGSIWGNHESHHEKVFEMLGKSADRTGRPSRVFWQMPSVHHKANKIPSWQQRAGDYAQDLMEAHPKLRLDIVPGDRMGITSPFTTNQEELSGIHYQCAYGPKYPEVPAGVKTPRDLDCRDLYNFNIMMLYLNSLCPVRPKPGAAGGGGGGAGGRSAAGRARRRRRALSRKLRSGDSAVVLPER